MLITPKDKMQDDFDKNKIRMMESNPVYAEYYEFTKKKEDELDKVIKEFEDGLHDNDE